MRRLKDNMSRCQVAELERETGFRYCDPGADDPPMAAFQERLFTFCTLRLHAERMAHFRGTGEAECVPSAILARAFRLRGQMIEAHILRERGRRLP